MQHLPASPPLARGLTRPPHVLTVVRDPAPETLEARIDWSSWYLTDEEDMGDSCENDQIIDLLRSIIKELLRERGVANVLVGVDAFFAWMRAEPNVRVSPDVYLLDDPPAPPLPRMWQTWLPGHHPPRLAIEVVSDDWQKDYDENPQKYALLGTAELVIFDPESALGSLSKRSERVALQVYRRQADGAFVRVHAGGGPVYSVELGAWLLVQRQGAAVRLRVSLDAEGTQIVPSAEEAREAEAKARQAAEQETAALRAELERLKRGR